MAAKTGLRTEIITNLILLMAAALLFVSFLLLKLNERQLLQERIARILGTMDQAVQVCLTAPGGEPRKDLGGLSPGLFPRNLSLKSLVLVDAALQPVLLFRETDSAPPDETQLRQTLLSGEKALQVRYAGSWWPFGEDRPKEVLVSVPILDEGGFSGAIQARFSLAGIRAQVLSGQRLVLIYVLLYGLVLVLFGGYLLGRTIVRPVLALQEATGRIADGDLNQEVSARGPREIAGLADSFNRMAATLRESRARAEGLIASLRRTNDELHQAQQELVRTERMASVGHLAAGMAHEIGNPLGAVVGYLGLLKGELAGSPHEEVAARALGEAERIDRLVRDLLDYAAPEKDPAESVDPAAVLAEARDLLAHQGTLSGLEVAEELPESLPAVTISRHKLLQVFVNLLINARDASAEGGVVRLSGTVDGDWVHLLVADEGCGMTPEAQRHIFDPFFTTKAPGKGRGLGLFVCHRIVTEAGGRIEVRSGEGKGTVFTVHLKRAEAQRHEA